LDAWDDALMRAEISGKLSTSSPSPQDRLEDTLTDGAFSTLAYLPRDVLADWLRLVVPPCYHRELTPAAVDAAKFAYWPTLPGSVEPDVVIRAGALMVVVEAKYQSGFHTIGGRHQLTAEWEAARRVAAADGLEGPVVVAVTDDVVCPAGVEDARAQLAKSVAVLPGRTANDFVTWTSWQQLAKLIEGADTSSWLPGHVAVRDDLFDLMRRRKVRYVFEGFKKADWWLLAAAAEAASERVYPTIAEFARELTQLGASRKLIWGGNDSGVVWYESKQVAAASEWHRNYIQLPMLHEDFGRRIQHYCALYTLFAFNSPTVRAGWWFQLPKGNLSREAANEIASWLTTQPAGFDVLPNTRWGMANPSVDRDQVTGQWVYDVLTVRGGWLRLERTWDPEQLTSTAQVLDVMEELSQSLLSDGAVLRALAENGVLDRAHSGTAPPAGSTDARGSSEGNPEQQP
jgi:hypothetical protein